MIALLPSFFLIWAAVAAPLSRPAAKRDTVQGFDISHYQGNVDFAGAYNDGARFVIIKVLQITRLNFLESYEKKFSPLSPPQATEGSTVVDSAFSSHYNGATSAGLIRGGYHFAHPDSGSGASQADFFINNGGGWSNDGITLPGMLDIEYNPGSGGSCYGLSQSAMVSWIADFVDEYQAQTSRYPLIYSTADWWSTCTGNTNAFSGESPLVLARHASSPGTVPGGWGYWTIWQYSESYAYGGDADEFNGDINGLQNLASG